MAAATAATALLKGNPAVVSTSGLCFAGAEEDGQECACMDNPSPAPGGVQTSAQ